MAKKRTVHVDVIVDDKGTTKKLAIDSDRLAKGLEKGSKGTKDFDRNLRGVIQTSAAGGRNFAALAQGIAGGIVPVYAAFAAQVFAIGAAFRFLRDAGDLATLEKGQVAYASSTGIALKTLTTRIQDATESQIAFQDAAQAAAIGTAAGLSADQLTRLGTAAKDASIILGRDVTDSFNRLVRGVTKAEPELLDELGIILRLKDATETYAASLGKSANDLSQFEKSQAVANDVLTQAEEKYGRIIAIVNPSVNVFNKFGKAFDDIVNSIKRGLDTLAPIFEKLAENPFATLLLAAPLLQGFLKVTVPGFEELGNKAVGALSGIGSGLEKAKRNADMEFTSLKLLSGDAEAASEFVKLTNEDLIDLADTSETGFLGLKKLQGGGKLAGKTITKNFNDAKNATGVFAAMPEKVRKKYVKLFADLQIASKASNNTMKAEFAKGTSFIRLQFTKLGLGIKRTFLGAVTASKNAVRGIMKNFGRLASGIGIVSIAFSFLPESITKFMQSIDDPRLRKFLDELKGMNNEFSKLEQIQKIYNEEFESTGKTAVRVVRDIANASATISGERYRELLQPFFQAIQDRRVSMLAGDFADINLLIKEQETAFRTLSSTIDSTNLDKSSKAGAEYKKQLDAILEQIERAKEGKDVTVNIDAFLRAKAEFEDLGKTIGGVITRTKDIRDAFNEAFTGLVTKGPNADLLANLNAQVKAYEKIEKDGTGAQGANLVLAQAQVKMHRDLLEVLEAQRQSLIDSKRAEISRTQNTKRLTALATRRGKILINNLDQELQASQKSADIQAEIDAIKGFHISKNSNLNEDQKTQLELLLRQKAAQDDLVNLLETQRNALFQIQDAIRQGLESGLETNLYDLLVGNENDLKLAAQKIAETVFDTLAKRVSGQLTDLILQAFGQQTKEEEIRQLYQGIFTDGAGKFKTALEEVLAEIKKEQTATFGADNEGAGVKEIQQPDGSFGVAGQGTAREKADEEAQNVKDLLNKIYDQASNAINVKVTNFAEQAEAFGQSVVDKILAATSGGSGRVTESDAVFPPPGTTKGPGANVKKNNNNSDAMNKLLKDQETNTNTDSVSAAKNENAAFINEKNVGQFGRYVANLTGLGGVGGEIASSVLTDVLTSAVTGGATARYGGVMKDYSAGGIARGRNAGYPAMLHGTEAVVPLPNGNSIPVEMSGSGGGVNNVSVSVNMGEGTTNVETEGEGQNLGRAIASAVQEELQKQKRPGGILSPLGAA